MIESSTTDIDATRPTSYEECRNIIRTNEKKLQKTYVLLKANPDLVLDTNTADHLCTMMQRLRIDDNFSDFQIDYIINRAWRHTSDTMYPHAKRLATWGDYFASFFSNNAQTQAEQQEQGRRIEDIV